MYIDLYDSYRIKDRVGKFLLRSRIFDWHNDIHCLNSLVIPWEKRLLNELGKILSNVLYQLCLLLF